MNGKTISLLVAMLIGGIGVMSAQGYYDDDIYFNPSKDKKKVTTTNAGKRGSTSYVTADYPAADAYVITKISNRDIDDYNRRGIFARPDSIVADSASISDFNYTRRIERFHNPDIIASSNDAELVEYYYAQPAEVNIIVNSPGYWGYPYSSWAWNPWSWGYGPSWYWNSWWGPSWSWNWGWGPSWSWGYPGWGPSWSWGWGYPYPGWGSPAWGWGGGYQHAWNPRHPGAGRYPAVSGNPVSASRPGANYRPGITHGNNGSTNSSVAPNRRPGSNNYNPANRPTNNNNNYTRPSNNTNNNSNGSYTRPGRNGSGTSSFGVSRGGFGGGSTRSSGGGSRGGRH